MLSIHYGMLRNKVYFSLDLSGITAVIRAGVRVFTPTLKNEVLLRNITNDIFTLPFPFHSFPFRRLCRFALPQRRGIRERIGREWVFD